jgi:hypothetical protein
MAAAARLGALVDGAGDAVVAVDLAAGRAAFQKVAFLDAVAGEAVAAHRVVGREHAVARARDAAVGGASDAVVARLGRTRFADVQRRIAPPARVRRPEQRDRRLW